jgi:hypothetical protein
MNNLTDAQKLNIKKSSRHKLHRNTYNELKYFHFNADYNCEATQHCEHFNIDYVHCSAYVDLTITVNNKDYQLQLQNSNTFDYNSYDCPTNLLSIYDDFDSNFFKAIQDSDLEEIQEYDAKITQDQLNELNKEFNIILEHYQKIVDEEVEEAENKKIYKEARIYDNDNDLIENYLLMIEDDEDFLNNYQNQFKDDFKYKCDEIKAKFLKKYQQENNISDDVINNFTCKFLFQYFQDTLDKN